MQKFVVTGLILSMILTACAVQNVDTALSGGHSTLVETSAEEPAQTPEYIFYDPVANHYLPLDAEFVTDEHGNPCITREQALEDYDYMWKTLEENAPYLADLPQDGEHASLDEIKSKHRIMFEHAVERIPINIFANRIQKSLFEINGGHIVGHVYFVEPRLRDGLVNGYNPVNRTESIACFERLYGFVTNPKTIAFYDLLNATDAVYANAKLKQEGNYDLEALYSAMVETGIKGKTPYIKLKQMGNAPAEIFSEHVEHATGKLQAFCEENKDADNIIIDIRGNGGGSDVIWAQGLLMPLAKDDLTYYDCVGVGDGGLNRYLYQEEAASGKPDDWPESIILPQKLLDFDMKKYRTLHYSGERVGFKGKVWLLADEVCYSASEMLIVISKQTGFATVVGTQSGGAGRGGQPWCLPLPNSGALIYYEPWYAVNDDGTCNQITGTKPDIDVGERDALAVCLELIEKA